MTALFRGVSSFKTEMKITWPEKNDEFMQIEMLEHIQVFFLSWKALFIFFHRKRKEWKECMWSEYRLVSTIRIHYDGIRCCSTYTHGMVVLILKRLVLINYSFIRSRIHTQFILASQHKHMMERHRNSSWEVKTKA